MIKKIVILTGVIFVVAVPFIFQRQEITLIPISSDDTIVIITSHNEALRSEYGRGFTEWYRHKTGKTVIVDWRHPGGGRDVARYVDSLFTNNFRFYWERVLKKPWTQEIRNIFLRLENVTENCGTPKELEVKRAFCDSNVGCDIDLLFGGGVFDHKAQCAKGYTVPSTLIQDHPELFTEDTIPEFFAGERLWDAKGCWIGGCLSSFGIIYNSDAIKALGVEHPPRTWMDLADPRYLGGIAVVDPTKSSSTLKSYEMLIQQQMQIAFNRNSANENYRNFSEEYIQTLSIQEGWMEGLKLIQKIVANGRYMTDSSAQTVLDVAEGNCPIGIATDFYGRSEKANIESRGAKARFHFVIPQSGCSPSPDPISLYRGAKHKKLALDFLEYVLTLPGQRLLASKVGTPGGPVRTALCRAPILKTAYNPEFLQYYDDPTLNPYANSGDFIYREAWTKPVFCALGFIFRVAFSDPEDSLRKAWRHIQSARQKGHTQAAEAALALMQDLSMFTYDCVNKNIVNGAKSKDYLHAIQYQTKIAKYFRNQYKRAGKIAKHP
ncbi:MAG: extracellular solute-binding protein [Puniceicoccales bacterium]|jgi:ABC-type Fe3+ transport system substrate-binding protein|nr:extracellular solute-binding protein [Puniceicoccales bacterium]